MQRQRGLTLLELLVVMAIIGLAMAGVSLALRDSNQTQLEREAQRLVAVLEAARAQSRTSGTALIWQPTPEGFVIRPARATLDNLSRTTTATSDRTLTARTDTWLSTSTRANVSAVTPSSNSLIPTDLVLLGPEPILAPVRITLSVTPSNAEQLIRSLSVGTDGLQPFKVMP